PGGLCTMFSCRLSLPPRCTLFPCTTLFRSEPRADVGQGGRRRPAGAPHAVALDGRQDRDRHWVTVRRSAIGVQYLFGLDARRRLDRKSTRLNSSHVKISYAVFCLKKKKPTE